KMAGQNKSWFEKWQKLQFICICCLLPKPYRQPSDSSGKEKAYQHFRAAHCAEEANSTLRPRELVAFLSGNRTMETP
uniref:Uncharacterized protein n=1 Tax=Gallus gallus TaxID=9031 RepID=A0A8V0X9L5_CHICK